MSARTIFITGSSSGLGRATTKLFAAKRWKVIATMRSPEKEAELGELPGVALLPMDVTDRRGIESTVSQALAMGDVDVVFSNAGYGLAGPLEGVTDEQMVRMVDTNLMGAIAEVVYEAATDGTDQLVYLAGADAKATYANRLQMGAEAFRKAIEQHFFG